MSTRGAPPKAAARAKSDEETLIADNRKAHFDYHVLETFEAGV
ncbi:MAG: SsrA-binding protein, partial [Acidobacteria bacterium]|nr:SsrA-binding protein [Acidobacteriota bacterium]